MEERSSTKSPTNRACTQAWVKGQSVSWSALESAAKCAPCKTPAREWGKWNTRKRLKSYLLKSESQKRNITTVLEKPAMVKSFKSNLNIDKNVDAMQRSLISLSAKESTVKCAHHAGPKPWMWCILCYLKDTALRGILKAPQFVLPLMDHRLWWTVQIWQPCGTAKSRSVLISTNQSLIRTNIFTPSTHLKKT